MNTMRIFMCGAIVAGALFFSNAADAALSLTAGSNATTTPNVATAITGFQIVGPAASTTPVKLRATSGTLSLSTVSGVTMTGNNSGTVNLSGTVTNLNAALSTLTYRRNSTGTDTLEVSLVNSGEIFFTDNGHLYEFVSGSYSWSQAKTAAEARTAYGVPGYLVTITSSAENAFVSQRLTGDGWIGASDSETENTWKWVTGPEAGTPFWQGTGGGSPISGRYSAWAGGEPNEAGSEDCAETYVSSGTWNDFPCSATLGYVVEFGAGTSTPTVVAQNISVVTADVPAITSLSPANGALTASTTANLTIGFSKSVIPQTGNIVIRKYSDNSIFESIDVAGAQITGSSTNTITINPVANLAEGTRYYITVPGTAFRDSSNNYFNGISASSTWNFTTMDVTAPQITALAANATTTSVQVTWTTNEDASSRLWYSANTSYASSTNETDTSPRVTSHSVALNNLVACTKYFYRVTSRDAAGNTATSTDADFTTTGCPGGAAPLSATSTSVAATTTATTTLSESGRTMTVETPANFTSSSTSVVIQIQGLEAAPVLTTIGIPSPSLTSAAAVVFDVKAIINNTTVLDSFNMPVTVSYAYTDEDIAGLDESSLRMHHYASGEWSPLDDCSVDQTANVITCTAPHFSIFAIFGTPRSAGGGANMTGTTVPGRVQNLSSAGNTKKADQLKSQWPQYFATSGSAVTGSSANGTFTRNLEVGMSGSDVKELQKFLNANGFAIATSGAGSMGSETETFGPATKAALIKFQTSKGIAPASGYFGPLTRAQIAGSNTVVEGPKQHVAQSDASGTMLAGSPTYERDLQSGMSGDDVRMLQQFLIAQDLGAAAKALAANGASGYFGAMTKAALAEWQTLKNISPASGYFGPLTRGAVLSVQ